MVSSITMSIETRRWRLKEVQGLGKVTHVGRGRAVMYLLSMDERRPLLSCRNIQLYLGCLFIFCSLQTSSLPTLCQGLYDWTGQ